MTKFQIKRGENEVWGYQQLITLVGTKNPSQSIGRTSAGLDIQDQSTV